MKQLALIVLGAALSIVYSACSGTTAPTSIPVGTTSFTVSVDHPGTSYNISGSENPSLTLQRGQTYTFVVDGSSSGHPFYIMSVQGTNTANAYPTGVTNNGIDAGTITFVVPLNATTPIYYNCSNHAAMTGVINITN